MIYKIVDSLIHFDKRSKESSREAQVMMPNEWLVMMMSLGHCDRIHVKPALTILENICKSEKTMSQKFFELEAVECHFSDLAKHLGLLTESKSD